MGFIFLKHLLIIICLCCGIIFSLLLYSKGFLLSRNVITVKATCSSVDKYDELSQGIEFVATQECYPTNTKVIVIVIDALRYDFMAHSESSDGKIYHNKFRFVQRLLKNDSFSRLSKFIADPPTTTMQRLHGMMTGSLPTFIDVGSNFASSEIVEDNLLYQLDRNNKKTVFLGDDTWISLFPSHFIRKYPYPSFDVWDLDTVDKGVSSNIFSEISKNDWDLLIAHFLGVDHCGHRYGPNHPEMIRKLLEMDKVIEKIVGVMSNDSILFVIGDHGMTENGDHGGESEEEVTAAMFVYSPSGFIFPEKPQSSFSQIDLLPTLSSILGVPIPFSNLGSVILEYLPASIFSSTKTLVKQLLQNNINQVTNYITAYDKTNQYFPNDLLSNVTTQYTLVNTMKFDESYITRAKVYIKSIQDMCKTVWTQFDFTSIIIGLICLLLLLLTTLLIYFSFFVIVEVNFRYIIIHIVISLFTFFIKTIYDFDWRDNLFNLFHNFSFISLLLSTSNLNGVFELFEQIFVAKNVFISCLFVFSFVGQFSNSFIIKESYVVNYLFITTVLLITFEILFSKSHLVKKFQIKCFTIILSVTLCSLIRMLPYYWSNYDDQLEGVKSNKSPTLFTSLSNIFVVVTFYLSTNLIIKSALNLNLLIISYVEIILLVLYSLYNLINSGFLFPLLNHSGWFLNSLPIIICFVSFINITIIFLFPPFACQLNKLIKSTFMNISNNYLIVYFKISVFFCFLSLVIMNERKFISSVVMFSSVLLLSVLLGINKLYKIKNLREVYDASFFDLFIWHLSVFVHFYGTGHQPTITSLQWDAVGPFTKFHVFIPGLLMVFNTFMSQIIHTLLLPLVLLLPVFLSTLPHFTFNFPHESHLKGSTHFYWDIKDIRITLFPHFVLSIFLQGCRVCTIMLSAAIHSRHLMVWRIFAPKFIFEGIGFIVSLTSLVISVLFFERVQLQINKFVMHKHEKLAS